jgi:hypothetical protein
LRSEYRAAYKQAEPAHQIEEPPVRKSIVFQSAFITLMIVSLSVNAQQSSSEPAAPAQPAQSQAPPSNAAPAAPAAPSDETLKKAKAVGLHAETRKGETVYCYEDANLGTKFTTKKCVPPSQLDALIAQRQANTDAFTQRPMTGTSTR